MCSTDCHIVVNASNNRRVGKVLSYSKKQVSSFSHFSICYFYSTKTFVGDWVDLVAALLCHSKNFGFGSHYTALHSTH